LKRIENALGNDPNQHNVTPEMQELYDRILGKGKAAEEKNETTKATNEG